MKINIKQLLVALGYGETTWKASRTRILKKLGIENASDLVMIDEPLARKVIETVAEVKTKTLTANIILGEKKYLNFTEVYKEEQKEVKTKTTKSSTSGSTTVKAKSQKELEGDLEIKKVVIRDLKKENESLKKKILELEKQILKDTMNEIKEELKK
ncbi:MAG: hypothetical protein ACRDCW_06655 [Sarcina sp.]